MQGPRLLPSHHFAGYGFFLRLGFSGFLGGAGEWASGHIEGATWIMGGDLEKRVGEVPTDRPVHVVCGGGYRSSVATSVLQRAGLREVVNVTGGMNAWKQRQLPTVTEQAAVSVA